MATLKPQPTVVADEAVVRDIRLRVDARLERAGADDRAAQRKLSPDQEQARTQAFVREEIEGWIARRAAVGAAPLPQSEELALAQAVLAALAGVGRLDALLRREDVENIFVFGCDRVYLELADGSVQRWDHPVAASDDDLIDLLVGMFARLGQTSREFSAATPIGNVRLPSGGPLGARMAAVMQVTPHPHVAIRRHRLVEATLNDLVQAGTITVVLRDFLAAAVRAGARIVVSGQWGAGKTTLLRALCHEIGRFEHVITVEDDYELGLQMFPDRHPMVTALEARLPNAEGAGEITLDTLVKQALRHSPKRLIVGEVRGGEVTALLRALSTGAGGMCSLHADSAMSVFDRIANMAQLAVPPLPVETAHRWTASAVDLIVHVRQVDSITSTGRQFRERFVTRVLQVGPVGDAGRPDTTELFTPRASDGRAVPAYPPSEPLLTMLRHNGFDPGAWLEGTS